jgi:hypothetical protein
VIFDPSLDHRARRAMKLGEFDAAKHVSRVRPEPSGLDVQTSLVGDHKICPSVPAAAAPPAAVSPTATAKSETDTTLAVRRHNHRTRLIEFLPAGRGTKLRSWINPSCS